MNVEKTKLPTELVAFKVTSAPKALRGATVLFLNS
jgi:hypothetical protein